MSRKVYVDVTAKFVTTGDIIPHFIQWEDGRKFEIDRVLDIRPAASLKAGGVGIRYKFRIRGQEANLYLEENKWFVEGRE